MFEDSLVESAALLRSRNRLPALLSITGQCAIAILAVSLPLLHPELIPLPSRIPIALAPPRFSPPPAPVQLPRTVRTAAISEPVATAAPAAPTSTSRGIDFTGTSMNEPTLGPVDFANNTTGLPLGIANAAPAGPHVIVRPSTATAKSGLARVSSGVIAGLLLAPIRPEYPAIARITHTGGTVVVDAIISRAGTIESAHVLSGPAVLQGAALAAVRQARYRPFMLNGQPTEVQTTITIVFRVSS